jgi:hypothetical protein
MSKANILTQSPMAKACLKYQQEMSEKLNRVVYSQEWAKFTTLMVG